MTMRGRTVAAFVIGFAVGAFLIGGGLWGTGKFQTTHMPPWIHPEAPTASPASAVPDTTASAQLPGPPAPPPEALPASPAGSQGTADRAAADAPSTLRPTPVLRLAMPIAGVDPKSLTNQFDEARGG